jgi:hypothetical protein
LKEIECGRKMKEGGMRGETKFKVDGEGGG